MRPLGDRIALLPIVEDLKTETGLIIPASMTENTKGKVVGVGIGTKDNPVTVKEGEIVLYPKGAGVKYEDYTIIRQYEAIGVVE